MNIIIALSIFTIGLLSAHVAVAETDNVYLRPIIGMGYTTISNSVSKTYESSVANNIDRTQLNGGFGLQVMTDVTPRLRLGVEGSFTHFINEKSSSKNHPLTPNSEEYCYHTVNTLALLEFKLSERFFIQTGSGLATSIMPNNQYTGTTPYFMIAPGINFEIGNHKTIPLMFRLSSLETGKGNFGSGKGFGSMLPVTVISGITLTF